MDLISRARKFLGYSPDNLGGSKSKPSANQVTSSESRALNRISLVNYFQPPRALGEANSLVPKIQEILKNYQEAISAYAETVYGRYAEPDKKLFSLNEMNDCMLEEARTRVRNLGRQSVWNQAWNVAWKRANEAARNVGGFYGASYGRIKTDRITERTVRDPSYDAAFYSATFAEWEVLKDSEKSDANPLEGMMQLYEMGLKPTFFREVEGESAPSFVVDINLDNGGLGCCKFGDKEILFGHGWKDYCQNLEPIKPGSESKARKFL